MPLFGGDDELYFYAVYAGSSVTPAPTVPGAVDFEAIQQALYDRLRSQIAGLRDTSRNYLPWDKVKSQPAMLVVSTHATAQRQSGCPTRWTIGAAVVFYARQPADPARSVETQLHSLVAQADLALRVQPGEFVDDDPGTNLGGLVDRCFRSNHIIFHGTDESAGQAVATLLVEMVAHDLL